MNYRSSVGSKFQYTARASVVVRVQGRDAVPVRALPFVTSWDLSPEPLAALLNDISERWPSNNWSPREPWLTAYQLLPRQQFRPIQPREWGAVVVALKGFNSHLTAIEHDQHDGYAQWRQMAMERFPIACFVWRDELESRVNNPALERVFWPDPDDPGAGELNYIPLFLGDTREMVMDGFQELDALTEDIDPELLRAIIEKAEAIQWVDYKLSKSPKKLQVLVVAAANDLKIESDQLRSHQVIEWLVEHKKSDTASLL